MMEHSNLILARAEHLIFLLILKLQHVESKIKLIQQEIKEQNTKEEDFMLLNNLIKIKNKISLKIGRSSF